MRLNFKQSFPLINEDELKLLEQRMSVSLPDKYRDFLLKTNGGVPDLYYLNLGEGLNLLEDSYFYGATLNTVQKRRSLEYESEHNSMMGPPWDELPPGCRRLIPVCEFKDSYYLYLCVEGPAAGQVYDYHRMTYELSFLAEDFEVLLNSFDYGCKPYDLDALLLQGDMEAILLEIARLEDVNASIESGGPPLPQALHHDNPVAVKALVNRGAKCDFFSLRRAASIEMAKCLLELGCKINEVDEYGWTPLISACEQGHVDVAKWLVENGADLSKKRYSERTSPQEMDALDFAKQHLEWLKKEAFLYRPDDILRQQELISWLELKILEQNGAVP